MIRIWCCLLSYCYLIKKRRRKLACFCFLIWHSPKIGARLMLLLLHCSVTIQFYTFSRACFNFVSKRFETTEKFWQSIFFLFQSVSVFFLYNPLFQCFETPEMGPGIFTFSRAYFNIVSKQLKHCGLVFSLFPELVSILFRNVSKQLKHLDLVNFLPVSVRFSFFPI